MSKKQILIVDDNDGLRTALQLLFEDKYELSFAASGEEAIRTTQDLKPQVILMDFKMAGITGIQTLQLLREELPTTQTVIMSAYDDKRMVSAAYESGAFEFVRKPFDAWSLRNIVDQAANCSEKLVHFDVEAKNSGSPEPVISQAELNEMIDQTLRVACL